MFVFKSKYEALLVEHDDLKIKHREDIKESLMYLHKYMEALDEVQRLKKANNTLIRNREETFTAQDIKLIISLCHPDKHNNSKRSNDITAMLLRKV